MAKRWKDTIPAHCTAWVKAIPPGLLEGLDRYFTDHLRTGGFLQAVLQNDLVDTIFRAHPDSLRALAEIVYLIRDTAPPGSWGSCLQVEAWIRAGKVE